MRADRLLSIMLLLQARGRMCAADLARELEVSRRTIYRDLEALSTAGVPVVVERGPEGGASLLDGYRTDLTGLTDSEVEALLTFGDRSPATALGLADHLASASRKLTVAARPRNQRDLQRRVLIDGEGWRRVAVPVHLRRVQDAIWANRCLRFRYRRGEEEVVDRVVNPYGLVVKDNTWYLLAATNSQLRTYRISRIEAAELLDETFQRPADFDLEQAWAAQVHAFVVGPPVQVTVRPRPGSSGLVLRALGRSVVDRTADGSMVLEFSSLDSAAAALAGFGDTVDVESPLTLHARLAAIGHRLVARYRQDDG